ncbi:18232_t:CDS:10, partial [Funneliformis geosporum]
FLIGQRSRDISKIDTLPEDWKFSDFYEYHQREGSFTNSFKKESFRLRRSLDYLLEYGPKEAKFHADRLDKNFKEECLRDSPLTIFVIVVVCYVEEITQLGKISSRCPSDDLRDRCGHKHRLNDKDSKLFWDRIESQLTFDAEVEMKKREMRLAEVGTATGIMRRIDGALMYPCQTETMDDYFPVIPPRTPPHRIVSSGVAPLFQEDKSQQSSNERQEFSDSEDHNSIYSTSDHEGVDSRNMQNVDNEDAYIKSIQLSQEHATEEIRNIIEKIKRIKCRLFEYRVVNLSARDTSDPVNKLKESEKRLLKDLWNSLEPSSETKTIRQNKWDKDLQPLLKKYQAHFEGKSVFDIILLDSAIEDVLARPYTGTFMHKEHFDLIWIQDIQKRFLLIFQEPVNSLCDSEQTELSYREDFVNPIIAKIVSFCRGEIENTLSKNQRNETRQYKQRVQIGCYQDEIYKINVNATALEIGFLEVVGSAIYIDVTKLKEDTEKTTEQQLTSLESYGIIVYQRTFTIYTMHRTKGGIYVVDKLTEFSIPNSKDQLYVLKEVIEKVYMFKSRVMDYYLAVQKITPTTQTYSSIKESPTEASPSKTSKTNTS